jgi:hypothetical protein
MNAFLRNGLLLKALDRSLLTIQSATCNSFNFSTNIMFLSRLFLFICCVGTLQFQVAARHHYNSTTRSPKSECNGYKGDCEESSDCCGTNVCRDGKCRKCPKKECGSVGSPTLGPTSFDSTIDSRPPVSCSRRSCDASSLQIMGGSGCCADDICRTKRGMGMCKKCQRPGKMCKTGECCSGTCVNSKCADKASTKTTAGPTLKPTPEQTIKDTPSPTCSRGYCNVSSSKGGSSAGGGCCAEYFCEQRKAGGKGKGMVMAMCKMCKGIGKKCMGSNQYCCSGKCDEDSKCVESAGDGSNDRA